MATVLAPKKDTQRIVEWDELPKSVKEIPDNLDPLATGILMQHQIDWLRLQADIKIASKGRRTGITFAEALDCAITAASKRAAGGDNVYYIGDTKDKGLEFIGYCARFLKVIAQAQGQGLSAIEEFLFPDQDENGNTKYIASYRIRLGSGYQIVALSSNPANIRGLQGRVVIDEAAYHRNVQAVLDAATALLIWGGRVSIISTHNGKNNAFNQLIKDALEGRYGDAAKVFEVTFDDAVANGLYERRCLIKGETPTAEGKEKWYKKIRSAYGPRKAQMREELDAIARDGNGICIPGVWIDDAMRQGRHVLRLTLDESFVHKSIAERQAFAQDWIDRYLKPELAKLDPKSRYFYSQDYARHRDFSVIALLQLMTDRKRSIPFVIELHNVPSAQQLQILWALIEGLPNSPYGALDATGSGETTAELTADKFGWSRVAQIKLNRAWYGVWMPRMVKLFEDQMIDMPHDENLAQDLRAIEMIDGIPMVAETRRADLKDPDLFRHGDFAIALCLANYAAVEQNKGAVTVNSRPHRYRNQELRGYDG